MKKILFLLLIGFAMFSCKPDDVIDKGQLDPNAMITIRPAKGVKLRSTITGLTALEIVQQAYNIHWQSHYFGNVYYDEVKSVGRTFLEEQKDFNTPALKMLGIDIITFQGDYYKDMTHAFNVVITTKDKDTIAYIPDEVINAARPLIEKAYNEQNYTEVYKLFDEAYVFYPIE